MKLICLDLEGVLTPEIWIAVAEKTGIKDLRLTTRDIADYDVLMQHRLKILESRGLKLEDIQQVITSLELLNGARDFLDSIREKTQVIILSDTFEQFAKPLMQKLGWPTIFCNSLCVESTGRIFGYRLRQKEGKLQSVQAFKTLGFEVLAAGDSYNDLSMLKAADQGILFRPPEKIMQENPQFPTVHTYSDFSVRILEFLK